MPHGWPDDAGRTGRGWDASPAPDRPRALGDDADQADGVQARPRRPTEPRARPGRRAGQRRRDQAEVAREICLRQLAVRPRTRAELAEALAKRGISDEVAGRGARPLRRGRHHRRRAPSPGPGSPAGTTAGGWPAGRSPTSCAAGVDGEVVSEALGELDEETEAETARPWSTASCAPPRGEPDAVFRRLVGDAGPQGLPAGRGDPGGRRTARRGTSAEAAEFADADRRRRPGRRRGRADRDSRSATDAADASELDHRSGPGLSRPAVAGRQTASHVRTVRPDGLIAASRIRCCTSARRSAICPRARLATQTAMLVADASDPPQTTQVMRSTGRKAGHETGLPGHR